MRLPDYEEKPKNSYGGLGRALLEKMGWKRRVETLVYSSAARARWRQRDSPAQDSRALTANPNAAAKAWARTRMA